MPWVRPLVAGHWLRRPLFDPRPLLVIFVMEEMALGQVFLQVFRFSPVSIIPPIPSIFPCRNSPIGPRVYSLGLLCPSDQLVVEISTCQLTRDGHPCLWRDSNPQFQKASGRRPSPETALLHTYLYPCFAFTRRTNGRSLRTFKESNALSRIRERWQKSILTLFFIIKVLITLLLS